MPIKEDAHDRGDRETMTVLERRMGTFAPQAVISRPDVPAAAGRWGWRLGLAAVLTLSALLNVAGLSRLGYGNPYYAAGVRSMLTSWHNLLYVSFDAGGFVSIDKPPLAFWLQAASARLLGFSGVSLLLPEAVAGVVSVALLHHLVARAWGRLPGLVAAALLAISPISVVASRSNIVDGVLVMVILLAAVAVSRAVDGGRLRWLLLSALLVGLGFNVKMLEAYLVLPALGLVYLLAAPLPWRRRILHLGAAAVVLVTVSLSWAVAVDLTPASQRPYVGSSTGDSELNLAVGYNGWGRVTGGQLRRPAGREATPGRSAPAGGFAARESGAPGPLRLLEAPLGSQVGWLLPLALVGLVTAAARQRWRQPADRRRRSLLLWGTWLLGEGVFFSVAGTVHAYYLAMLGPAIAALAGIGLVTMWREVRSGTRRGWVPPVVAVVGVAAEAAWVLSGFPAWSRWLTPLILACAAAALLLLAASRWRPAAVRPVTVLAALAALVAMLAGPATWTADTVAAGSTAVLPSAGPPSASQDALVRGLTRGRPPVPFGGVDPALLRYLESHQGSDRYLVGSLSAMSVAPYMLASDRPALALGGFMGRDRIVDPRQLAGMVGGGEVRDLLVPAPAGRLRSPFGFPGAGVNDDLVAWVRAHCAVLPPGLWSTPRRGGATGWAVSQQLYDCGAGASESVPGRPASGRAGS
jgi:4-amino-4-deoxy-L-arabinose transferase-like glycosyltransferase